ncbi:L-cystine transport system permease protein [Paenibacillus shirakamiensis]|uniref:L-cystine transport system permease protein n=1 Tax=Paenibacillus shirakamiensis TaxID=1265935 RepID=A0ABS4JKF4_9BACL|nr:amino acid ABC transporter permease [Paenibacillus shirakamiensis]MBP2001550.1 L-cystine transport system permease protein [Paenibacillus shirakamiensis]
MNTSFQLSYVFDFLFKLLGYVQITLFIVASSIVLGLVVGLVLALPRMYQVPLLKQLSAVFVSFFRGTPVLIQLFLIYFGVPELLKVVNIDVTKAPVLLFVILTYTLNSGAFLSEIIRGAVAAVDRGQVEAAYAVGMSKYQAFVRIMLPQALSVSIPIFANKVLANLKETSLAFTLGLMDINGKAQSLGSLTNHFVESYIALSALYFVMAILIEQLFLWWERRMHRHEQGYISPLQELKFSHTARRLRDQKEDALFNSTQGLS